MLALLRTVDDGLYRAERAVVGVMVAAMGLVVFLDVLHRVSTRAGSWLASPVFVGLGGALLAALALRTRGVARWHAYGVLIGAGLAGGQRLLVLALPNGLIWSQTLALGLTLWVGILGASLAAHDRRHLALDVGSKLWPRAIAHRMAAIGHWVTAAFCALILYLGLRSVSAHHELWTSTEHAAGTLTALPVPKWAVFASIPYGMAILVFRFTLEGVLVWTGQETEGEEATLKQLGIHTPGEGAR